LELKPGTRIVSNSFTMGDWSSDETANVKDGCASYCTAHLWIVPAKAEGSWQLGDGELMLKQTYQMLSGSLRRGANDTPITNGKLNGDQITFNIGSLRYTGKVTGGSMEGTIGGGGQWKASQLSK
jgi:hypothetical protein